MKVQFSILFFAIILIACTVQTDLVEVGFCECGIFGSAQPVKEPLLVQNLNRNTCNNIGEYLCVELCGSISVVSKPTNTDVLCSIINEGHNIYLHLFSRNCEKAWHTANLAATDPICCKSGKNISCRD